MSDTPRRHKRSPRLDEIAEAAGVSVATVDRVLNERDSVSAASRHKVVQAARRLGVQRLLPLVSNRLIRIDLLLPANRTPFFNALSASLQQHIQMLDKRVLVQRREMDAADEALMVQHILRATPARQGLIVTAPDTPAIRGALNQVIARGEPVVTMVTDVAATGAHAYVGIDNFKAGRTAGLLLRRLCVSAGRVLVLSTRQDYVAHDQRRKGIQSELAGSMLGCEFSEATLDDADQCFYAVSKALSRTDAGIAPLVGIYNTGGGAPGIAAALQKHGLLGRMAWVGHEASAEHRRLLAAGQMDFVMDQDAPAQAIAALQHMLFAHGLVDAAPPPSHPEPRLYCAANLV